MDSPIAAAFVRSAAAPAVLVTILFFVTGGLKDPLKTRLQGLILALAYFAGAYLLLDRLNFPPKDVSETFGWMALILGAFVVWNPKPLGTRYFVRALVVLALMLTVLWPLREQIVKPIYHRNLVAFFCLGLGVWSIVERTAGAVRTSTLILLPMIAATALSLLTLYSSSASLSQLVSILCAFLGGLFLLACLWPNKIGRSSVVPFLSVFVVMMMVAGHFYLDINPWHLIYLCLPFLILWIRSWFTFVPENPVAEGLVFGLLSAAPLGYFIYNTGVKAGPLY
jgi:hypothetical protein